jgi:superfamily I DNA/RNA helicase
MLAISKANRLAAEGFRTLFTCFNRSLGLEIEKTSAGVENLTAIHFHELCLRTAEEYSGDEPGEIRSQLGPESWNTGLAEMLGQCVADNPDLKWDAIVVDEGQDFQAEWWVTLMECLRDPDEGFLWVFHDDNQLIFQERPEIPDGLMPVSLDENLRNTQTIHGLTERFYSGPDFIAAGPDGRDIDFRFARDHAVQRRMVSRIIHDLIHNEGVPAHDIAVLTGVSIDKSGLMVEGRIGAFECTNAEARENGKVVVDSVWRFKGLESPVVILAETRSNSRDGVLYVAASRARSHLIVIGDHALQDRMGLSAEPSHAQDEKS